MYTTIDFASDQKPSLPPGANGSSVLNLAGLAPCLVKTTQHRKFHQASGWSCLATLPDTSDRVHDQKIDAVETWVAITVPSWM